MKTPNKNYGIHCNGGYFDGLQSGLPVTEAKLWERSVAIALNKLIFCGKGRVVKITTL